MARPVRLLLATQLGGDIDGAWWPHTSSVAQELSELVGGLHEPLGEIIDIRINWAMTEGPMDVSSLIGGCAKLLVVPHITSPALGLLVMRCAAAKPVLGADGQAMSARKRCATTH
jgi:hypothetical protein